MSASPFTRRRALAGLASASLAPGLVRAQGFAGLGVGSQGFAEPDNTPLEFPRDYGAHSRFRIEWWYLTANLTDVSGRPWGLQWTLFRAALDPDNPAAQAWLGHAALTGPDGHRFAERMGRGSSGQAGVSLPFEAYIDEWRLEGDPLGAMTVSAGGADFAYHLSLRATGPLVLHGDHGYSQKAPGAKGSPYYSQPFLLAEGEVRTPSDKIQVKGIAWIDREWSSAPLASGQQGWDWFALTFSDGAKLMAYRLRGTRPFIAATWIFAEGQAEPVAAGDISAEPEDWTEIAGRKLPLVWRLILPGKGLDIRVSATYPDAWMATLFPYWEGPVIVSGSTEGRGYLEMTGYR
jgi:predicted secreted hydrolase